MKKSAVVNPKLRLSDAARLRLCGAFCKTVRSWLAYQSQRHITPSATEEIKLDGYRAIAVKSGRVNLYSRRKKPFSSQYPFLVEALREIRSGRGL